jgi:UDP-arabinose 4-epimerase
MDGADAAGRILHGNADDASSIARVRRVARTHGALDDARVPFTFAPGRAPHVVVTGGAGFIGSHCVMQLLERGYAVTAVDNLSRGNGGAIRALRELAPVGSFRAVYGDLGHPHDVDAVFGFTNLKVDTVFHFAAIAYVGESMADPLRYYSNITSNTVHLLDAMRQHKVNKLIYSSTCATYGNVEKLPITESTPTKPINPYGKAKLYAENAIRDYALANPKFKAAILRYFNVFGGDPKGRVGELPRAELREHGRISGACFDAALGIVDKLTVMGTKHATRDGTTIRDFVHVVDLVDAHIAVAEKEKYENPPSLYNVGTGRGVSMKEFVEACTRVTEKPIKVSYRAEPRPGDYAEVYANVDKIQHELGWKAKYTNLEASLEHAWSFRKQRHERWD